MIRIYVLFKHVEVIDSLLDGKYNTSLLKDALCSIFCIPYLFCPGVDEKHVNEHTKSISTLVSTTSPILQYQSNKCIVRYESAEKSKTCLIPAQRCANCNNLTKYTAIAKKRKAEETPTRKLKRVRIDSNYSVSRLSPASRKVRLQRVKRKQFETEKKLQKLQAKILQHESSLNEEDSDQMTNIVDIINNSFSKELSEVVNEVPCDQEMKDTLVRCWENDSQAQHQKDVSKFWEKSSSLCCPSVLQNFTVAMCQIPKNTVKDLNGKAGENQEYLLGQGQKYRRFIEEQEGKGLKAPIVEGILVFDEVKVIDKIIWNSKSHEFIGFAMSPEEFPFLNDVYDSCRKDVLTTRYVLQFLWRDVSSPFDVAGPHFMFDSSLSQESVLPCLDLTIRIFENSGFHTVGIVCDGASDNLALIKQTMGVEGPLKCSKEDKQPVNVDVQPYFYNPYYGDNLKIHWIICPSHQLKNMISALHSARPNGSKQFKRNGQRFGWQEIKEMKEREDQRVSAGQLRYEPKLLQSYIIRDTWKRLNVKPSKIFQQDKVLSEIYSHALGHHKNSPNAMECYRYLRAVNKIFEEGLLASKKVSGPESKCFK